MEQAQLDINYIASNVQLILDRAHKDATKRKMKVKSDRIIMACPICGDSSKDNSLKRGRLFFNNLYYKCHNEDCRSTFTKLCTQFEIQLDPSKKLDLVNYIDAAFNLYSKEEDEFVMDKLNKMIDFKDLQAWFDSGKAGLRGFKQVSYGSKVYYYLIDRGIPKELTVLFYEGIHYNGKWSEPYVVFLNRINEKVIGMQYRNLKNGHDRKFKVFSFQELYQSVYDTELDPIEAIPYNKVSYFYNILGVNFERTVTCLEGYIDSLFVPNSIGGVGINTDWNFLANHDIDLRFFFDNDDIGKRKALERLKKGYTVFLWEKVLNDLASQQKDPHSFKKWFNLNIKDLNKLMQTFPIHYTELEKWYSKDIFDSVYLTTVPYVKAKNKIKEDPKIHNIDWDKKIKEIYKNT